VVARPQFESFSNCLIPLAYSHALSQERRVVLPVFPISRLLESLPREQAVLLQCLRPNGLARLTAHGVPDAVWDRVVEGAIAHGVAPLLLRNLQEAGNGICPLPALERLAACCFINSIRASQFSTQLCSILEGLESAGVPAVPVKGPALAVLLHGHAAFRQYVDLDVVVRRDDLFRAKDALVARGYQCVKHMPHYFPDRDGRASCGFVFDGHGDFAAGIEISWGLKPASFDVPLYLDHMWERRVPLQFCGREIPAFGPEDMLVFLCIHGYKHFWQTLGCVSDVAQLVASTSAMDWDQVFACARVMNSNQRVLLGLLLASELLQAPVPAELRMRALRHHKIVSLARRATVRMFDPSNAEIGLINEIAFLLRTDEQRRATISYLARTLTCADNEREFLRLPGPLAFLYHPYHLARLARTYGKGVLRRFV
jgi:hypothetical protein